MKRPYRDGLLSMTVCSPNVNSETTCRAAAAIIEAIDALANVIEADINKDDEDEPMISSTKSLVRKLCETVIDGTARKASVNLLACCILDELDR